MKFEDGTTLASQDAPELSGTTCVAQPSNGGLTAYYGRLPILLQQAACSVEGARIQLRRYGNGYAQLQREIERRSTWSAERIADFRDQRLAKFVRHAAETCGWYRDKLAHLRLDSGGIRGLSDLAQMPVLSKTEVQDHPERFTSTVYRHRRLHVAHTSGTTGGALRFPLPLEAEREQWAVWWRYRAWHGINPRNWCGYFGGRSIVPVRQDSPPFWRYNYPGRQIMFSAYHMSPGNLPAYVEQLRQARPAWLHGYPSVLGILAGYLADSGEDLGYQVRWITTGAENLLPHQVNAIERAFGVRPRQHYGMAEGVANFSECEYGRLHVDEDFAAVEFLPAGAGSVYRVIGTNLSNPAMPLIRYDTGDLVRLTDENCPCGRWGRLVGRVDGRQEDYVVLRDGTRIGRMDHVFKDMVRIREAQIRQRQIGSIEVWVVRGTGYADGDERAMLREIGLRLGQDISVSVHYCERLPRTARGKLRLVVSELSVGRIDESEEARQ